VGVTVSQCIGVHKRGEQTRAGYDVVRMFIERYDGLSQLAVNIVEKQQPINIIFVDKSQYCAEDSRSAIGRFPTGTGINIKCIVFHTNAPAVQCLQFVRSDYRY